MYTYMSDKKLKEEIEKARHKSYNKQKKDSIDKSEKNKK